jgi:FAD/FMN-containing dehydrogenase
VQRRRKHWGWGCEVFSTWYDRRRPEPFAAALRAAKAAVDPTGALNPGVLIDV